MKNVLCRIMVSDESPASGNQAMQEEVAVNKVFRGRNCSSAHRGARVGSGVQSNEETPWLHTVTRGANKAQDGKPVLQGPGLSNNAGDPMDQSTMCIR